MTSDFFILYQLYILYSMTNVYNSYIVCSSTKCPEILIFTQPYKVSAFRTSKVRPYKVTLEPYKCANFNSKIENHCVQKTNLSEDGHPELLSILYDIIAIKVIYFINTVPRLNYFIPKTFKFTMSLCV